MNIGLDGLTIIYLLAIWPVLIWWFVNITSKSHMNNFPVYYVASIFWGYIFIPLGGLTLFLLQSISNFDSGQSWGQVFSIFIILTIPILPLLYFKKKYRI
jgi:hypothetical protein